MNMDAVESGAVSRSAMMLKESQEFAADEVTKLVEALPGQDPQSGPSSPLPLPEGVGQRINVFG